MKSQETHDENQKHTLDEVKKKDFHAWYERDLVFCFFPRCSDLGCHHRNQSNNESKGLMAYLPATVNALGNEIFNSLVWSEYNIRNYVELLLLYFPALLFVVYFKKVTSTITTWCVHKQRNSNSDFMVVITHILPAFDLILLAFYVLFLVAGLGCKRAI